MLKKIALVVVLSFGLAAPAHAQMVGILGNLVNRVMNYIIDNANKPPPPPPVEPLRAIPDTAVNGIMSPPNGRDIFIDGEPKRLSPGATIRDANNRILLPMYITVAIPVRYQLDRYQQVHRVWILTPREYAALDQ